MIETGRIREVSGDLVVLDRDRTGGCEGCGGKGSPYGGCGLGEMKTGACLRPVGGGSGGCFSRDREPLIAVNREKLPLVPGLRVAVKFSPGSVLVQTLTALLPPFFGFVAGYMAVPFGDQALRAAAGGAGLFIFAGIVFFFRGRLPLGRPTVVYYKGGAGASNRSEFEPVPDIYSPDRSLEGPFN
jgi:hypothetical protein